MTGPQGMGPLAPQARLSDYDALVLTTLNPMFYIMPLSTTPTYSAWETMAEAVTNDIVQESVRGKMYFRSWVAESGNVVRPYDAAVTYLNPTLMFEILPGSSMPTYSAWESRATAYSTNIAQESVRGRIYFRGWFTDSGNAGLYEDFMNDSQMGTIYKIEDGIT